MVDQLAAYYASQGQPVVFVEQYALAPIGDRYGRFWAAFGGGAAYYPLVIIDSGHSYSTGPINYYDDWKGMIDAELARPPQAQIEAHSQRIGNTISVHGRVTNLSSTTLSVAANEAEISIIVYEDIHAGVTSRYVRAVASQQVLTPLAYGGTLEFSLQTPELARVDWARLHALALIDYRPGGHVGAFDMLQSAVLIPTFAITPTSVLFMIDPAAPAVTPRPLSLDVPPYVTWTASANASWLSITPPSGTGAATPSVSVDPAQLSAGWQEAIITFSLAESGLVFTSEEVAVKAFFGPYERTYLPVIAR